MSYRTSRSFERNCDIEIIAKLFAECFMLSAGVCEYRSGNEHGNPICLATGELIERMNRKRHAINCVARVGGNCSCGLS